MTDEKDQASSMEPPKYRALRDGTGYEEGDVFIDLRSYQEKREKENRGYIDEHGYPYAPWPNYYICENTRQIFFNQALKKSPDFEEVEEIWEQGVGEYRYRIEIGWPKTAVMSIYLCEGEEKPRGYYFRTESDAQSCLGEVLELIKKRSKESRRL